MMIETKYVIIDGSAIVFSGAIQHKDMVGYNEKCEGAGFVIFAAEVDVNGEVERLIAKTYGKSISLGIESRQEDAEKINRQILNQY
jgi:hypothetical protein